MAEKGTYTAYQQLRPLEGDITNDIINQEQLDFNRRGEKREIDAIAEEKKNKEQLKKDKLREDMLGKIPKNYDTGSSSLNEFQARFINDGANRLGEIAELLSSDKTSDTDKIKLKIEAQNIQNLPSNLKVATDNFSSLINDYQKGKAEGSYFDNPDFEKLVMGGFENYVGHLDNGLPTVGFIDRNKDGVVDVKDVVTYDNLSKGIGNWQFQPKVDLDKIAVSAAGGLKAFDNTQVNGYKTTQNKAVPEQEIKSKANAILFNQDGSITPSMKSELRKRGLQDNEQSRKLVSDYLVNTIKANTERLYKEDYDFAAANSDKDFNYKVGKDQKEDKPTLGGFSHTGQKESVISKGGKETGRKVIADTYQYDGKPITRSAGKGTTETMRSFQVDKDGNLQVVVDVVKPKYTPAQISAQVKSKAITKDQGDEMLDEMESIGDITYSSKDANDIVMAFGRQFLNPTTRKKASNAKEIVKYLKSQGSSDNDESAEEKAARLMAKYRNK